jgi:hypothetical protein
MKAFEEVRAFRGSDKFFFCERYPLLGRADRCHGYSDAVFLY